MELIDKQAAIDAIGRDPMGGLNYERILRDMPVESRWIPCSERVPECEKPVLVTGIYGAVFIAIRKYDPIYEDYIWWHSEHGRVRAKAWMPLPEPYEERREEE